MAGTGVELLFGTMLIGVLLSTALFGVLSVQMLAYYQAYKKDSPWIRYFMLYLYVAEAANLLFVIGIIYEPLIIRYGSPEALITSPRLLPADAISIVSVSTPIQFFTAWRIGVITDSIILPTIICLLSVLSFGGGVFVTIFTILRPQFSEFQSFTNVVAIWLFSSAVCDILIAVILTYSLWIRKTGSSAVDGQINRIIRLTVQTGTVTAATALLDVILFLSFPTTTAQFIPDFPLSKLYSISLLSTLNARRRAKVQDAERVPNALFKESTLTQVQTQLQTGTTIGTLDTMVSVQSPVNQAVDNQKVLRQASANFASISRAFKSNDPTTPIYTPKAPGGQAEAFSPTRRTMGHTVQLSLETLVENSALPVPFDALDSLADTRYAQHTRTSSRDKGGNSGLVWS